LLFSKELQLHFTFQCDWLIFARVIPPEQTRILRVLQFLYARL
jgi:hypothetical protein